VTWVRIGDRYPDLKGELDHFLALDGEAEVGMVRFNPAGIDAGSWMWSMLLVHPGPAFRRPTSGTTPTRREAARGATQQPVQMPFMTSRSIRLFCSSICLMAVASLVEKSFRGIVTASRSSVFSDGILISPDGVTRRGSLSCDQTGPAVTRTHNVASQRRRCIVITPK
jgi:hypothetical protein